MRGKRSEFVDHIAEVEGVKTPTKKRSKKEVEKAFGEFTEKRAASKKAKTAKTTTASKKAAKSETPKSAAAKSERPTPTYADPIPMNFISPDGYVREAAFDPKTQLFYVGFEKSTWAIPSNADQWKAFEKAVADPDTNIDSYYRKAFRGRVPDMLAVRKAPAKPEVAA